MKKFLLLGVGLIGVLTAGTITLNGNVEVVSIVGFDKTEVESSIYNTNTNTFKAVEISTTLASGQKFVVNKNIYAKSNSSDNLEMHIETTNFRGGLLSPNGFIEMQYKIRNQSISVLPGNSSWIEIPTTAHETTTLTNGFEAKSKNTIQAEQQAGEYSIILNVTIRAKIS
jgi:hypothetical protein